MGERTPPVPYLLRQVRVGIVSTGLVVGALALAYFVLSPRDAVDAPGLAIVLGSAAAGAAVIALLPWKRLFETTGMWPLYVWSLADIVLISFAIGTTGGGRSDLYVLYTLTTFFFVASYPPIAQVSLLLFTAASYTTVLLATGWEITAGAFVARLSILGVLAYLAWYLSRALLASVASEGAARREAVERARLISGVVVAGRDMTLDPSQVTEVVLDAVVGVGFEDAAFVALGEDGSPSHVVAARGRFADTASAGYPLANDVTELVVAGGETVIVDGGRVGDANAGVGSGRTTTLIGTPIWVGGWMAAVLVGWSKEERSAARHRLEAFELLATNAGLALDNAGRYEEQRRTVERLEESERLKSDFLTSVSHELRTPLTSILGNALTLERTWGALDDGTRRDLVASLSVRARELDEKIGELVEVAGSESATRASFHPVDLSMLLAEQAAQMAPALSAHGLVVAVRPGLTTFGDATLLAQVVRNLLANAATHTPDGTTVILRADADEPSEILVSVSDDGPGIAATDLPYIGARFFRGGDPNLRPKGLGLGLALASSVLELHGSALEVESEEGRGAAFAFRLPALEASETAVVAGGETGVSDGRA